MKLSKHRAKWTHSEDVALVRAVQVHGFKWRHIRALLGKDCSEDALRNHYQRITSSQPAPARRPRDDSAIPAHRAWSAYEDHLLVCSVWHNEREDGRIAWENVVAALGPGRTQASVRNRLQRLHAMCPEMWVTTDVDVRNLIESMGQ